MSGSTGGDNRCRVPGPGPSIMAAASWCLSDGPKAQARRVHETNWTPIEGPFCAPIDSSIRTLVSQPHRTRLFAA